MKRGVRGACAALGSCALLGCALGAAAAGLRCLSLGAGLRGEPFRLGAAAGAFYSGLLLAGGLALLGAARLCRGGRGGPGGLGGLGDPGGAAGAPATRPHLLLLGVLVFMLGVLSAFAGAVIDGDTVSLVERKYSHYCLPGPGVAGPGVPGVAGPGVAGPGVPGPRPRGGPARASPAQCRRLKDYQRGLVLSTVFNALECLLGLLGLLLAKNHRAARARRGRRGRRRARGGPGLRARRGRRGRRGRRLQPRPSDASALCPEDSDCGAAPGDCAALAARHAVAFISVGAPRAPDAAGVEVTCGGHPSVELPGYAPSDPDLSAPYPYCCRPPCEAPRPGEPRRAC